jgi:hypothetical protein
VVWHHRPTSPSRRTGASGRKRKPTFSRFRLSYAQFTSVNSPSQARAKQHLVARRLEPQRRACVCFVRRDDIPGKPIEPYTCTPHDNTLLSDGKTPMICTPGTDPFVFYFAGGLNKTCPSCDSAERTRTPAEAHPPPDFIPPYARSCQRQADR